MEIINNVLVESSSNKPAFRLVTAWFVIKKKDIECGIIKEM